MPITAMTFIRLVSEETSAIITDAHNVHGSNTGTRSRALQLPHIPRHVSRMSTSRAIEETFSPVIFHLSPKAGGIFAATVQNDAYLLSMCTPAHPRNGSTAAGQVKQR